MAEMERKKWEPIATKYNPLKVGSIDGTDVIPHDHGIVRAMEAEYKPNKLVIGDPKATVFVGRLNPSTTEDTLEKAFSRYGKIKRLRLIRDIVTGFSKRYAFIEYRDKYDCMDAVTKMNKRLIDDREILVDFECERLLVGWIPRRLGGGLSGKKESGQLRFGGKERPFKRPLIPFKDKEEQSSSKFEYSRHRNYSDNYDRQTSRNNSDFKQRDRYSYHYRKDDGNYRKDDGNYGKDDGNYSSKYQERDD